MMFMLKLPAEMNSNRLFALCLPSRSRLKSAITYQKR